MADFQEFVPEFEETQVELESIVAGIVKTDEEKAEAEEEKEHVPTNVDHLKDVCGIPDYWKVAVSNNMLIQQAVHKQDKEALTFIKDVKSEKTDDPKTITIKMFFSENEFFSNDVLTYTVKVKENGEEPAEVIGCGIDWKDGKDLSKKKIKKKQKHKKTNETRTIVKTVPTESFFNIFESKVAPTDAPDMEDEDSDMERLMMGLDEALDVA